MYTTAYYSEADWNDTRFFRPDFDKLLLSARAELDQAKRASMYREMAIMVRDEGGVILPMFNDFINAVNKDVQGYVHDIGNDISTGFAAKRVWLTACDEPGAGPVGPRRLGKNPGGVGWSSRSAAPPPPG